ncbi:hypothetical protein J1TS5_65280 [Paenibacillus macerans]|nr:hypothetical protein J1TS5_65280 [Paenibacillus macerans]
MKSTFLEQIAHVATVRIKYGLAATAIYEKYGLYTHSLYEVIIIGGS